MTKISTLANSSQLWTMCAPRLIAYDTDWSTSDLPLLSLSTDSVTGVRYSRAYLALIVVRKPDFVLWNMLSMSCMIGCATFCAFALEPTDLGVQLPSFLLAILAWKRTPACP